MFTLITSSARGPCPLPRDTTSRWFSIPTDAAYLVRIAIGSDPRERMKTQGVFSSTSAKTYSKQRPHGKDNVVCDDLESVLLDGLRPFDVLLSTKAVPESVR